MSDFNVDQFFDRFLYREYPTQYPPLNIIKTGEDDYKIVMAVAGFSKDDIVIKISSDMLTVAGNPDESDDVVDYLYRGLSNRSFVQKFKLYGNVDVTKASFENGLLTIELQRNHEDFTKVIDID